jgi:GT2 family glycosyltransferase/lipopolysaccharide/colanic/teichoic acid biosynthesis glycosyltransferase
VSRVDEHGPVPDPTGQPGADTGPLISLIIVHYRTPETLSVCLDRIEAARISLSHEILVMDNDPLDDSAERLCSGRSAVIYTRNEKNLGFGRAVNQGLARGGGEYLLVLNPDVEVLTGSVEEMVRLMKSDPSAGLIAPKLLYPDGTIQDSCRTFYTLPVFLLRRTFLGRLFPNHRLLREHLMLDFDHAHTREVDWCLGASLLARRRAVEDVGPMDERFFLYFEDVDWCYRMAARGWKVLYHPAAVMIHRYERASARRPGRGLWIHLASTVRYYEKWSFLLYWLKRRSSTIRRIVLVLSDLVAVNLAFVMAYGVRALSTDFFHKPLFGLGRYTRFLFFSDAVAILSLALAGMYRSRRSEEGGEQLLGATRAMCATALIMMASTFLFASPVYSRLVITLFLPLALLVILIFRWGIFHLQGRMRSRRIHLRRIGILAPPEAVEEVCLRLGRHPDLGLEVLPLSTRAALIERPRGGEPTEVPDAVVLWVQDERIAEVVLFEDWPGGEIEALTERLGREGVPVRLVPESRSAMRNGFRAGDFLGFPALQLAGQSPTVRSWEKRLADAIMAVFMMLVCSIPFAIAFTARALAGRPMVERVLVGRRGRTFRSASLTASRSSGVFALINDFPTLLLWLRGEWSLVGIHPFGSDEWDALPESYRRFPPDAAPGWITLAGEQGYGSLAAVCASNSEYVARWSLALDVNLILERLRRHRGNT